MTEFLPNSPEKMVNRETRRSGIKLADLINTRDGFRSTGKDKDLMPNDERLDPNAG